MLGVQWLQELGKVTHDYANLTIEFNMSSKAITLSGDKSFELQPITFNQLQAMIHTEEIMGMFELIRQPPSSDTQAEVVDSIQFPENLPDEIMTILQQFKHLFHPTTGLPPRRLFNHIINLLSGTKPVNVRPYRYPHFQKGEIEKLAKEMLEQGIIQESQSPFSSPVLLVKKKDGTYRFCVDYRALNTITVQDNFPIPTTDELFDELGKARFFTKLDLRAGYHQIRIQESDVYKTAFRTHEGHYEFLVMPFGLTNAPSTFQAAMNRMLSTFLRKFVIVFFMKF